MNDAYITKDPAWNKCLNLLLDPKVSEIAANGPGEFFMKRAGQRIKIDGFSSMSEKQYFDGVEFGLAPFVKSQNEFNRDSFIFEGRLEYTVGEIDVRGRCHVVLPPATNYPQVTIAKKTTSLLSLEKIASAGSMSDEMRKFLELCVRGSATVVFSGASGAGKALTLDTKIPTPTGWTTMGDIQVGDQVFDRFGKIVNVTHKFPQPARPVYEVEFSTGEKVYCDAEHNWLVSTENSRKRNINSARNEEKRKRAPFFTARQLFNIEQELKNCHNDDLIIQADLKRILERRHIPEKIHEKFFSKNLTSNKKALLEYALWYGQQIRFDQRKNLVELYSVKTAEELMYEDNKWGVPVLTKPVKYKKSIQNKMGLSADELPIHPYLLGLWLGDGSSRNPSLTALEEDALEYNKKLEEFGLGIDVLTQYKSDPMNWKINVEDMHAKLNELNIKTKHNGTGSKKHIPEMYLYADEEARRLLIAGLIDTDGWVHSNSTYFTNKNKALGEGFQQLVHSLGYKSTIYNKRKMIDEKLHEWFEVRVPTFDVFALLQRKQEKSIDEKTLKSDSSVVRGERRIKNIVLTDRVEEMSCITVDGEDSTYLITESFIPTHNTTMLEAVAKNIDPAYRLGVAEDTPELNLTQPNTTYLHSTPWAPGMDPNNVATLDWVVAQFMRNRCDKLIIGETRGKEFAGFLTASNSGMEGGMTTIHAETPTSCLRKMTSFTTEAKPGVPVRAINMDIATAIQIIVQLIILPGGKHRVSHIEEITPTLSNSADAQISTQPLYLYDRATDSHYKAGNMSDSLRAYFESRGQDVSEFLKSEINKKIKASSSSDSGGAGSSDIPRRELPVPSYDQTEPEQRGLSRRLPTRSNPFNSGGKRSI